MYSSLAEGIVDQEENTRNDVLDQCLGAEPDCKPDNARAGQQRQDVDAEFAQISASAVKHDDRELRGDLDERQERPEPSPGAAALALPASAAFGFPRHRAPTQRAPSRSAGR